MKKQILALSLLAGSLIFSCSEKIDTTTDELKSSPAVIAANEVSVDNSLESIDYEADLYSFGIETISEYNLGLKNGDSNMNWYQRMFQNMMGFKNRYKNGVFPNLTFTATNGTYPITLKIDYGTGIELANGHVLKGSISLTITAAPFSPNSERILKFEEFSCNGNTITGTVTKTRTTDTETKTFKELSQLRIALSNGTVIERNEEKVKTWEAGVTTQFDPSDDIIKITGVANVADNKGNKYTRRIVEPLIRKGTCKYIVQGIIELTANGIKFLTIDYGTGECDNIATKTNAAGETEEIKLGND